MQVTREPAHILIPILSRCRKSVPSEVGRGHTTLVVSSARRPTVLRVCGELGVIFKILREDVIEILLCS